VQLDQSGPPCRIRPNATPSKKLLWSGRQGDGLAPRVRCIGLQNSGRRSTVTVAAATDLWAMTTGVDQHAELGTHDGKMMNEFPRVRIGSRDSGRRSTAMAAAGTDLI